MGVTIYHNSKCSKSRKAVEILELTGCVYETVEYLKTPLTAESLLSIFDKYEGSIEDFVRTGESEFKENPFALDDSKLIASKISVTPKLLQRPIVIKDEIAVIGRPIENIEMLLKK